MCRPVSNTCASNDAIISVDLISNWGLEETCQYAILIQAYLFAGSSMKGSRAVKIGSSLNFQTKLIACPRKLTREPGSLTGCSILFVLWRQSIWRT
jgi:hypothetical protein